MRIIFTVISFVLIYSMMAFGQTAQIDIPITAINGPNIINMRVGLDQRATSGIDGVLGESILAPLPPAGFDARFDLTNFGHPGIGTWKDYRNTVTFPFTGILQHEITWQLALGQNTFALNYVIPAGATMRVTDLFGGGLFNSGELSGSGTYNVPFPTIRAAGITMTYTNITPPVPVFSITPPVLNFNTVTIGNSVSIPVVVNNPGSTSLVISNINSSNEQFTYSGGTLPITVVGGGNIVLNVTFTPTASGLQNGNLIFTHNAVGSPEALPLSGSGQILPSGFDLSSASLNFGNLNVGSTAMLPVTVTNTGTGLLVITNITSSNAQFTFTSGTLPLTVSAGGNTSVDVTFTPVTAGVKTANLVFTHNAAGSPAALPLSGNAQVPVFGLSSGALNFGNVNVGSNVTLPVNINNTGDGPLVISNIISGNGQYTFTSAALPITISGGGNTTVNVTFTPISAGLQISNLVFTHNASGSPSSLSLSGTGQVPVFAVSPASLHFNTLHIGNTAMLPITVRNTGGAPLIISNIISNESQFTFTAGALPITVVPGDSSIISVNFAPLVTGIINGTLTFTHNAGGGTSVFNVDGTGFTETFTLSVNVIDGWNMVSIPGLHPVNQNVNTWWSARNMLADVYKWSGSYTAVTNAAPTEGYWMLHTGAKTYNVGDEWPAGGIQYAAHDPIAVMEGWNMIGGYDASTPVSALTTTPPGLIVPGTVYGWGGSYTPPTNLVPGYGYWIYLSGAGVINIPSGTESGVLTKEDNKENWGNIILTDASGKNFTLYSVNGEVDLDHYLMPPLPPSGCFDVRYSTGRRAEYLNEGSQTIEMRGIEYPIVIKVEDVNVKIQDETGRIINKRLIGGEELIIRNKEISKLLISEFIVPDVYSLLQNYPNPFNPGTMIQFSLPEDAANVSLNIYDALGQTVAELVNGAKEAGYYKYQWDASDFSSGLYIYQLKTEKFVSTKKMILLK